MASAWTGQHGAPLLRLSRRLSAARRDGLARLGLHAALPIQAAARAPISSGRDVLLHAETGSGKTLAFLLPAMRALDGDAPWQVLVVAPTELLAGQIARIAAALSDAESDVAVLHAPAEGGAAHLGRPRWMAGHLAQAEQPLEPMLPNGVSREHTSDELVGSSSTGPTVDAVLRARVVVATPHGLAALATSPSWAQAVESAHTGLRMLIMDEVDALLRARTPARLRAAESPEPEASEQRPGGSLQSPQRQAHGEDNATGLAQKQPADAAAQPRARQPEQAERQLSRAARNRALDASPLVRLLRHLTLGSPFRERSRSTRERATRERAAGRTGAGELGAGEGSAAAAHGGARGVDGRARAARSRGGVQLVCASATASAAFVKDARYALLPPGAPLHVVSAPATPAAPGGDGGAAPAVAAAGADEARLGGSTPPPPGVDARRAREQRGVGAVGLPAKLRHHFALCESAAAKLALALQVVDQLLSEPDAPGTADGARAAAERGPRVLVVGRDGDHAQQLLEGIMRSCAHHQAPASARAARALARTLNWAHASERGSETPPPPAARLGSPAGACAPVVVGALGDEIRGLDLPSLQAVLLLCAPRDVDEYAHAAGRAARAGRAGHAVSLLTEAEWRACNGQLSAALGLSTKPRSTRRLLQRLQAND